MRKFIFAFLLGFTPLLAGLIPPAAGQTPAGIYCYQGPANPQWVPCPADRTTTNSTVTITTGNTFQTALAAASGRLSLTIQNNNSGGTDNCWVFIGPLASATKATSIVLSVTQAYTRYFPYVPSDAINVTCATTSDTVYVDTQ